MSRQAIGLIIVLLLFVGLLVVRAGIGNGMGRVYSERESVDMVKVESSGTLVDSDNPTVS